MGIMETPYDHRQTLIALGEVARLIKTYVDRRAAEHGMTHVQWGVLKRVQARDGLMQAEIAEQMDLQPISLVPILDKLCEQGLIERRADPKDRRAKLLFLTGLGRDRLDSLGPVADQISAEIFKGLDAAAVGRLHAQLTQLKDNIKRATGFARATTKGE